MKKQTRQMKQISHSKEFLNELYGRLSGKGMDINSLYPSPEVIKRELEVYNKWREEQTNK